MSLVFDLTTEEYELPEDSSVEETTIPVSETPVIDIKPLYPLIYTLSWDTQRTAFTDLIILKNEATVSILLQDRNTNQCLMHITVPRDVVPNLIEQLQSMKTKKKLFNC